MKHCLLLLLAIVATPLVYAQDNGNQDQHVFDIKNEMNQMVSIPNSPEAEAFKQYGDHSVSLFTGAPNITVPIYTHKGKELDLPISLTYDATGVKVEELATQVGLSWNLQTAGRVSRIVNGMPDDFASVSPTYQSWFSNDTNIRLPLIDYINGYVNNSNTIFDTSQEAVDYFQFLKKVSQNEYETQPDYYSFNAMGLTDHVVIDMNTFEAKSLTNPRRIVTYQTSGASKHIISWKLIDENGTTYYFDLAELTHSESTDANPGGTPLIGVIKDYNSSWVLTKVESPNKRDTYVFHYDTSFDFWTQPQPAAVVQSISNNVSEDGINGGTNFPAGYGDQSRLDSNYKIKQVFLNRIDHNSDQIVTIDLASRYDLGVASKIERINIHNRIDKNIIYKKFNFNYSYFGVPNGNDPSTYAEADIRLKLDEMTITSGNNTVYQEYSFEYESPDLIPSRTSLAQDYLGYYNGAGNTELYPQETYAGITYGGANRSPNFNYSKIGLLKKIFYPTGGYTEFEYEPHYTPLGYEDVTTSSTEVSYGGTIVQGGLTEQPGYPYYCGEDDIHRGEAHTASTVFEITNQGLYSLRYSNGVSGPITGFPTQAYIVPLDEPIGGGQPTALTYDQIASHDCSLLIDPIWIGFNSVEEAISLDEGWYQVILVNPNDGQTSTINIFRNEVVGNPNIGSQPKERAGRRIKTLKDYTATGVLAKEKQYQYTVTLSSSVPTGVMMFSPSLSYTTQQEIITPGGCAANQSPLNYVNQTTLNRVTSSSGGDRPHVGYSKVFEIVNDFTGTQSNNGYSEYNFKTQSNAFMGIYSDGVPPNLNYYNNDFQIGKEIGSSIFATSPLGYNKKTSSSTRYQNDAYYINYGFYVKNNGLNANHYPIVYYNDVGDYYSYYFIRGTITYNAENCNSFYSLEMPRVITGYIENCGTGTVNGTTLPYLGVGNEGETICYTSEAYCDYYPNTTCIGTTEYSTLQPTVISASGKIGNTLEVIKKEHFGTEEVVTRVNNIYDANIDYLLKEVKTTNSKGEELKKEFSYPKEHTDQGSLDLVADNQLTIPITTKTYKDNALMSHKKNTFETHTSGGIYLKTVSTAKSTNALEERIVVDGHDLKGNLIELHNKFSEVPPPGGGPGITSTDATSYIWGYDYEYPIVKAVNASHNELVTALGTLSETVSSLQTMDNATLKTTLDGLRALLPNAQLTTYTYLPQVGIETVTDPRGYTMTYSYDEFHRLLYVKDAEGNVLSKNEYHYAN